MLGTVLINEDESVLWVRASLYLRTSWPLDASLSKMERVLSRVLMS